MQLVHKATKKPAVLLENWVIYNGRLFGNAYHHPTIKNGHGMRSGTIQMYYYGVPATPSHLTQAETYSTMYFLGTPA